MSGLRVEKTEEGEEEEEIAYHEVKEQREPT